MEKGYKKGGSMDIDSMISEIKKLEIFTEVYHEEKFQCYRRNSSGEHQEVFIKIYDRGSSDEPETRFSCKVVANNGKTAKGNSAGSINTLLSTVHWDELD